MLLAVRIAGCCGTFRTAELGSWQPRVWHFEAEVVYLISTAYCTFLIEVHLPCWLPFCLGRDPGLLLCMLCDLMPFVRSISSM